MATVRRFEAINAEKPKIRASNIELLRILTMLGVVVLHYNNAAIGGGFALVEAGSVNNYVMHMLESFSIIAVDLFVLITGYFMCRSTKRDIFKPFSLLFQVIVFKEAIYIAAALVSGNSISLRDVLINLLPNNYFVILYSALYLVSPFINVLLDALNSQNRKRLLILLIIMFSLEPTCVDVLSEISGTSVLGLSMIGAYGSQWGYSIVNFILMYIIGAQLRSNEECIMKVSRRKALLGYLAFVIIDTGWSLINEHFTIFDARSAYEYCNPLVIGASVLVFIIFHNTELKESRIINDLAKASFTVYLTHTSMLRFFRIEQFVNKNTAVYILHECLTAVIIYMIGWVLFFGYDLITKPLFAFITKRIPFYKFDLKAEKQN